MHGTGNLADRHRRARRAALALAVALAAAPTLAVDDSPPSGSEADSWHAPEFTDPRLAARRAADAGGQATHMRWKLTGVLGWIAGLFVPNHGDALLTAEPVPGDRTRIQLLITAPRRDGEYFLYGADVDSDSGAVAAAWSAHAFRKDREARAQQIEEPNVVDMASAVYLLARDPPKKKSVWSIWNRGELFAAEIEPLPPETRRVGDARVAVRGYAVRGASVPGLRSFEEKLLFYFTAGTAPQPVEIVGTRGPLRLRLRVVEPESADPDD